MVGVVVRRHRNVHVALDASVVNTILPIIRGELHSDIATVQWAITVYLLVTSVLLLCSDGWAIFAGTRPSILRGSACSLSLRRLRPLAERRCVDRLPRGPGRRRGHDFRQFAGHSDHELSRQPARTGAGLAGHDDLSGAGARAALAGWLAETFSWRAVFYVNVPVGIVALAVGTLFIPSGRRRETAEPFDYRGAMVFMVGLFALLLALNQGHSWGWASPEIVLLLAASPLLLTAFVLIELRTQHPMLDLSLFRRRVFSASVGAATLNYICMASIGFLMPFYLLNQRHMSPARAGMLLSVQPLVMAIAAPIAGTISDRIRSGLLSALGMLILPPARRCCRCWAPRRRTSTLPGPCALPAWARESSSVRTTAR